jgi:paraquat-inducible protein A
MPDARAQHAVTGKRLRGCPDCGQFQIVPALAPGSVARCFRCGAVLRRVPRNSLQHGLILYVTALVLLAIACNTALIDVDTFGMRRSANLFSGPLGFGHHDYWGLAIVVGFMILAAPLLRVVLMTYVLLALCLPRPPAHLRIAFRDAERLRPWAMVDVFLLGLFVAYTELPGMIHVEIGIGLYALIALMLVLVVADVCVDNQAVWEAMEERGLTKVGDVHSMTTAGALACQCCGFVSARGPEARPHCPRCGVEIEEGKPDSIARTWALVLTAAMMYIPANLLPVLAFDQLGSGSPHTIIGGARELINAGMWPLAALVFLASIGVPCLKLVGLVVLLVAAQTGSLWQLRQRAALYRLVRAIGRWSMIDIFMESVLIGLVQFGSVVTISPGAGAVAFAGVVILTMLAAESFDPILMWSEAQRKRSIGALGSSVTPRAASESTSKPA